MNFVPATTVTLVYKFITSNAASALFSLLSNDNNYVVVAKVVSISKLRTFLFTDRLRETERERSGSVIEARSRYTSKLCFLTFWN